MNADIILPRPVALVTGSTSGIGREVARILAADGFSLLIHGRHERRGKAVVDEIVAQGGQARFVGADLTDPAQIHDLGAQAAAAGVEVLVNDAGFSWFGPSENLEPDHFDTIFAVNVKAAYYLVAAVAPVMAERGTGSIINLGSMSGQIGIPGAAAYSATKAALAALTRAWAAEYSPRGVRVNTVAAGPAYTGVSRERTTAFGEETLLARAAEPAEIADVIAFLASPKAAYITGALIPVDGGRAAV